MANPTSNNLSDAIATLRAHLLKQIEEAEKLLEERKAQLRTFELLQVDPGSRPMSERELMVLARAQEKGRTQILREAMMTFGTDSFTPASLQARAIQLYPDSKNILSIVAISKVLNKLLTAPTPEVVRLEKGAGRKEATYMLAKK